MNKEDKKTKKIVISNKVKYHYFQNDSGISIGKLKKEDLALLEICEKIYNKEKDNTYKDINQLANIKLARSYFSILARIAKAGYKTEDFPEIKALIRKLTNGIRKNYRLLMKSPIPLNRKMLITIFGIDYRILAVPYRLLQKEKE